MKSPSLSSSFLFFFAIILVTHAFDFNIIQMQQGSCPYTVVVRTSCDSPQSTSDQIGIAFGDADGDQVYVPRLGGPVRGPGILGKCSTDTFQVKGKCLSYPICSLFINQTGLEGWIPESIEVYAEGSKSIKFDFSKKVPKNTWYGQNNCNTTSRPSSPEFPPETRPDHPPGTPESPPETRPDHPPGTPESPPETRPDYPPGTPESPPERHSESPPPPALPIPSDAFRRGDGESVVFAFAFATVVAIATMVR